METKKHTKSTVIPASAQEKIELKALAKKINQMEDVFSDKVAYAKSVLDRATFPAW